MRLPVLALLLCLWPGVLSAQTLPQPTSDTVNDFADLLTPQQEAALSTRLSAARKATGVHVALATFRSRAALGLDRLRLESFATRLFNDWGIGDATRNDGVLILVLPEDRDMRIELGAGYPASFDTVAQTIIDRDFLPAFRRGDYAQGIRSGTDAVIARIAKDDAGTTSDHPARPASDTTLAHYFWIAIFGVVFFWRKIADFLVLQFRRCPKCTRRGLQRHVVTVQHPTQDSSGLEEVTTTCPSCGHREVATRLVPSLGNRRSSGGGFGGGRSSGGGASGRW